MHSPRFAEELETPLELDVAELEIPLPSQGVVTHQ